MMMDALEEALVTWRNALDQYEEELLLQKPLDASWSMGQLFEHLIAETSFYLAQMQTCLSTPQNSERTPTAEGKAMLAANEFPDRRIEGPPSNAGVQQPKNKAQLVARFDDLLQFFTTVAVQVRKNSGLGKTAHPGLGYLTAGEWAQFAAMHLRHHLRQKARIDSFLAACTGESRS